MKKLVIVLTALFAMSNVVFADQHGNADHEEMGTAETSRETKDAKKSAAKKMKMKAKKSDTPKESHGDHEGDGHGH